MRRSQTAPKNHSSLHDYAGSIAQHEGRTTCVASVPHDDNASTWIATESRQSIQAQIKILFVLPIPQF